MEAMTEPDRVRLARQSRRMMQRRLLSPSRGVRLGTLLAAIAIGTLIVAVTERASRKARLEVAERRIVSLLEKVARHQQLFHDASVRDDDGDGRGEYGFLQQIGGLEPVAGLTTPTGAWQPTLNRGVMYELATAVRDGGGVAQIYGYRVTLYLHGVEGATREAAPLPTLPEGPDDVQERERRFSVYAWPERWNGTGRHVYVLTGEGAILRTDAGHELEGDRTPEADAFPPRPGPSDTEQEGRERWSVVSRPQLW